MLLLQVNVSHFVKHWVVYLLTIPMTVSTDILNRNGWLYEQFASCIELSIETWVPPKFHAPVYGSVYDAWQYTVPWKQGTGSLANLQIWWRDAEYREADC